MPYGDIFSFANNQKVQQAAEPDDNYGMPSNWAPINSAPIDPNKPAATRTPASVDPYGSGPLPPNFGYQPALVRSGYGGTAAPIDLMPIQGAGVTQANAKAIGVATHVVQENPGIVLQVNGVNNSVQNILNITGSGVTYGPLSGQVQIATGGGGDGLVHGSTPWETDASFFSRRDDFTFNGAGSAAGFVGETSWAIYGSSDTLYLLGGGLEHPGFLQMQSAASAHVGTVLFPNNNMGGGTSSICNFAIPLLDYGGWKSTWIFNFSRQWMTGSTAATVAFSMANSVFYLGFMNDFEPLSTTNYRLRPPVFMGLRYDTDTGLSVSISSIAKSGTAITYTVTSTAWLGGNGIAGQNVTFTGTTSGSNDGTFLCTASTATTIVVYRASGGAVQAGAAGTATTATINDSYFTFEYAVNPIPTYSANVGGRNNTQTPAYVQATTIQPTEGTWYRFDMESTVAGTVVFTLTGGGSTYTWTLSPTATVVCGSTVSNGNLVYGHGLGVANISTTFDYGSGGTGVPFGNGSQMTFGGSSPAALLGQTVTFLSNYTTQIAATFLWAGTSWTNGNYAFTLTGFPAFVPGVTHGSNTTAGVVVGTQALNLDFYGFVWNPGLAGAAVNTGYSRFFSGT